MSRAKYWCFTYNNYESDTSFESTVQDCHNRGDIIYAIFGREVGESGTPHLQGYIQFSKRMRLTQLRKLFGKRLHWERSRGTPDEATAYCKKDGDYTEYGSMSEVSQGVRSDLQDCKTMLDDGKSVNDLAELQFSQWCRYRKSFEAYVARLAPPIRLDLRVVFLHGPPGTGKTGILMKMFPNAFISSFPDLQWFDGYNGQEVAIIDDYRGNSTDAYILRVLDIYPLRVPIKGSTVNWIPKRIFLTSNLHPTQMHVMVQAAFLRRIHLVQEVKELIDLESDTIIEHWRKTLVI